MNLRFLITSALAMTSSFQFFVSPNILAQEQPAIAQPTKSQALVNQSITSPMELIKLEVQRIKSIKGQLFYQLLQCPENDSDTWNDLKILDSGDLPVTQDNFIFSIETIRQKSYIIRVFQDLNENRILDYSSNDVPKEPTGFSNNPSLMMGEPSPLETCFDLKDKPEIVIKMNNKRKKRNR